VRNQSNYCNCYANSYLTRHHGRTLAAITQLSEQAGQTGTTLVDLVMSPERQGYAARSCEAAPAHVRSCQIDLQPKTA
jgi:hypothetical protein